jgi:hypothetical protein
LAGQSKEKDCQKRVLSTLGNILDGDEEVEGILMVWDRRSFKKYCVRGLNILDARSRAG